MVYMYKCKKSHICSTQNILVFFVYINKHPGNPAKNLFQTAKEKSRHGHARNRTQ